MTRRGKQRDQPVVAPAHTITAVCTVCPYGQKETLVFERVPAGYRLTINNSGGDFMAALVLDEEELLTWLTDVGEFVQHQGLDDGDV